MVLSAGVAYAESSLSLSGSARMGVTYSGKVAGKAAKAGTLLTPTQIGALTGAPATAIGSAGVANDTLAEQIDLLTKAINGVAATYTAGALATAPVVGLAETLAKAQADRAREIAITGAPAASGAGSDAAVKTAADNLAAAQSTLAAISGAAAVADTKAKLALENRITIDIGGSIETTSGLTFGGKLRIRSDDGGATAVNGARVYMATNGLEVGIGNIYGAINSMPNFYHSEVGLTGNGSGDVGGLTGWAHDSYSSTGGANGIEVMYSAGGVSAHVSVTDTDIGSKTNRTAAHLAYTAGDWTVAVGGQSSAIAAEDFTVVTAAGTVGTLSLGLSAMDADVGRQITLSGAATMGATNVQVFVSDSTAATATDTSYGIGIAYDLGGASLLAGVEKSLSGQTYADMGVSFSF